MVVNIESFSSILRKEVFTDMGNYVGRVSDLDLDMSKFKVRAIVVDTVKGSAFSSVIGSKKGVVVPFNLVQAVGDVIIIKHVIPRPIEEVEGESELQ